MQAQHGTTDTLRAIVDAAAHIVPGARAGDRRGRFRARPVSAAVAGGCGAGFGTVGPHRLRSGLADGEGQLRSGGPNPVALGQSARRRTVHLGADADALVRWVADLTAGTVPRQPFMLFGQMSTA